MARILIVDDEEMERMLEKTILEKEGHQLFFAANGEAALTVCKETKIELIITDLAMPDFNGLRFIKALRKEGVRFPIIAVSGWAADQLDLAEDYGADLTLTKPIDGPELLKAVRLMLEEELPDRADPWEKTGYL